MGLTVKTITPHRRNTKTSELVDGVLVKRFRYLPQKFEVKNAITDEVKNSSFGLLKISFMSFVFFFLLLKSVLKKNLIFYMHIGLFQEVT